jgi:hypothetical protein
MRGPRNTLAGLRRSLLAILAAAVFLAACLPQEQPSQPPAETPPPAPTSVQTATATVDWFPATSTPTLAPSPVFTPTPDLRPGLGQVLLQDDFTDPQAWQTGKNPAGNMAFGKNVLTLAVAAPKGALFSLRSGPELGDYYLEVTAAPSLCRGADAYGLLLRAASTPNFYRFSLTCDGQTRLERIHNGSAAVLQDWTPRIGPPLPSRLGVWIAGDEIRVFIDNYFQFSARDPVLTGGSLGLFARAAGDSALTVSFSDLVVRQVGPDPAPVRTLSPTSTP